VSRLSSEIVALRLKLDGRSGELSAFRVRLRTLESENSRLVRELEEERRAEDYVGLDSAVDDGGGGGTWWGVVRGGG